MVVGAVIVGVAVVIVFGIGVVAVEVCIVVVGAVVEFVGSGGVVVVVAMVVIGGMVEVAGVKVVVGGVTIVCEPPQEAINGTVINNTAISNDGNTLIIFKIPVTLLFYYSS